MARIVAGALLGALVSGAGAWVIWASEITDEAKVIELIEIYSPYITDKKALEVEIGDHSARLVRIEDKIDSETRDVAELLLMIRALARQLDSIEKHMRGERDGSSHQP